MHVHARQINAGRCKINTLLVVQNAAVKVKPLVIDALFHDGGEGDKQGRVVRPAQRRGQVSPRVCVQQQHFLPLHDKPDVEVRRGRGLGDTPFGLHIAMILQFGISAHPSKNLTAPAPD